MGHTGPIWVPFFLQAVVSPNKDGGHLLVGVYSLWCLLGCCAVPHAPHASLWSFPIPSLPFHQSPVMLLPVQSPGPAGDRHPVPYSGAGVLSSRLPPREIGCDTHSTRIIKIKFNYCNLKITRRNVFNAQSQHFVTNKTHQSHTIQTQ